MDATDLDKLRRFALATALVLVSYELAGITIEPHALISVLGVPFRVSRPDLLPAGLAVASLCSAARFYYYGLMLGTSPHRRRRDLIDELMVHSDEYIRPDGSPKIDPFAHGQEIWMYWGPRKFGAKVWRYDREIMEKRAAAFDNAFPKFAGARSSAKVVHEISYNPDGDEYTSYNVEVIVPLRCRIAALFEDIDYTAPVWLNALALLLFVWTVAQLNGGHQCFIF
jgi:hypothetical protein